MRSDLFPCEICGKGFQLIRLNQRPICSELECVEKYNFVKDKKKKIQSIVKNARIVLRKRILLEKKITLRD
jgi:hypothetical protein